VRAVSSAPTRAVWTTTAGSSCERAHIWRIIEVPVLVLALAATIYLLEDAFDVAARRKNKERRFG
jgi:type IV secretory pathway TrbF-like protein